MTTSAPIIRRATANDLPAIVALLADDDLGALREDPSDLHRYRQAFNRIDADPNQSLVVLVQDDEIIGTLQLTLVPGLSHKGTTRALIEAVRISSTARGGGFGTQLMKWAIAEAEARGAGMIQLTSNLTRTDAHRFYQHLGFEQSHAGFKLAITANHDTTDAIPAGVTCDPELGICTFEGDSLPATGIVPNIAALGNLATIGKTDKN